MDEQIKRYADSVYEVMMMDSTAALGVGKVTYLRRRAAMQSGSLPLGGNEIGSIIQLQVEHIERLMSARLESYKKAFAEVGRVPTEQDFAQILDEVGTVQRGHSGHSATAVKQFIQSRGSQMDGDAANRLMESSGHGYDRVLREWKMWKAQAGLQHIAPGIVNAPVVEPDIMSALQLLYPDFTGYGHYFRENKLKEAVAAAFERFENRLNEIRDESHEPAVSGLTGRPLVYKLFDTGILDRPFAQLGGSSPEAEKAYKQGLTGILSGGISWIRNAYTHEKHNLPDLTPSEALELLFVASYLMRMLDLAKTTFQPSGGSGTGTLAGSTN